MHSSDCEEGDLGKGRFSCVKRAQRNGSGPEGRRVALKIVDKKAFWSRVETGMERKDTLVRELTVQAALTYSMCNHPSYFPPLFVKLLGVHETFKHLIVEMEVRSGAGARGAKRRSAAIRR